MPGVMQPGRRSQAQTAQKHNKILGGVKQMKQRILEQTKPKKLGGSVYITLSPVVRRVAGIEIGQAVTVIAEAGKIVIVKEEK